MDTSVSSGIADDTQPGSSPTAPPSQPGSSRPSSVSSYSSAILPTPGTPPTSISQQMCATPSIPMRMPASLFTKDRTAFVGLGWSNMATALPPMTSLEEKAFLSTLLQELNLEFALQLDTSPKVDRLPHTPEVSGSRTLIFGGGSHTGRLAAAVGAIYPEVVDLTGGGWKVSEKAAEYLAYDIENVYRLLCFCRSVSPNNLSLAFSSELASINLLCKIRIFFILVFP